jgi:predicted TIM-barrel fold metal-dependent hydrolase
MIVDIHVHPLFELPPSKEPPPRPTKYGEALDLTVNPNVAPYATYITSQLYSTRNPVIRSIEDFIKEMDEAGINKIVFQNAASKGAPMRMINEGCSKLIQSYPERFIGFAGYDPLTGKQAVKDIEYAVEELGFKGMRARDWIFNGLLSVKDT